MLLQIRLERRLHHAAGVIGNGRRRDDRDDFKQVLRRKTRLQKLLLIVGVEAATLFDQCLREPG